MTLEELGSLGEFVSSVAVVISLVYVALQVKQSSRSSRISSRQSVLEASRNMMGQYSTKEYVEISLRASRDGLEALTDVEKAQYKLMRGAQLRNIENAFLLMHDGVLDVEVFESAFEDRARRIVGDWPEIVGDYTGTKRFNIWLNEIRQEVGDA